MEYPIYKNRPIPPVSKCGNKTGAQYKYPWAQLEVGDCFAAAVSPIAMNSLISHTQKKTGHKYTRRSIDGKEWVWRIK